ncbi:MAG: RNA polymerase sigma factor [Solirubrobacterales bacterium]|nr:RNA polymerase sigma factor [Solirubrobacterales bacterium]
MSPRLSELLLSSQSDERLVSLARAGHERAFVAIVERYRPELNALARRLCPDGGGEDVVQQAFLSAFAALRAGAEVEHLRGWLYRILRNAATRPPAPLCVPLDGATASAETVEDVVQQRAIAMSALSEMARLPARQRQAMVNTALGGMGRAEVASSMGLSEGAVRQLVHRARHTLRTAVTAVTPWPLARWLASVGTNPPGSSELAAGAGAASSGGLVIKLGALLASGTLVTGVAAVENHHRGSHGASSRPAIAASKHASPRRGSLVLAAVATSVSPGGDASRPGGAVSTVLVSRTVTNVGTVTVRTARHPGRHESSLASLGQRGAGALGRGDHRFENGRGHAPVHSSGSGRPVGGSGQNGVAALNGGSGRESSSGENGAGGQGRHHGDGGGGRDFGRPIGSIATAASPNSHGDQPTGSRQLVAPGGASNSGENARSGHASASGDESTSANGSSFRDGSSSRAGSGDVPGPGSGGGGTSSATTGSPGSVDGAGSGSGDGGRTSSH